MQLFTKLLSFSIYPIRKCILAVISAVMLVSCGGGGTPTYTVGGTVSGLTSGSLVLKNNSGDDLTISANSTSFTFTTAQASGAAYAVTAGTRPSRLACDITNNTGTIAGANVTGVTITCISPVYVVNNRSNTVSMYAINATTGQLTALATPTVATGTGPSSIAVNPAGTFAYVAAQVVNGSGTVSMYAINATTGQLTALTTPTVASPDPFSIAVNPAGTFAYVANGEGSVSMYAINATSGVLTALATPTVDTGDELFTSIAVNPAGTFAYLTNILGNSVSMFSINATTGQLTALSTPTVSTGISPISIAVNPAGTFAYVANLGNATVSMYSINATTGILTALATPTVAAGNSPFSIAFK